VNGREERTVTGTGTTGSNSPSFTVPAINSSNIRTSGQPSSNIFRYDLEVRAYNATGYKSEYLTIWNFPGMSVNDTNRAELIETAGDFSKIVLGSAGINKSYVLMNSNVVLSSHTPIGTSTEPFTGNFFGNGHTITISGWSWGTGTATPNDIGLFGAVTSTSKIEGENTIIIPVVIRDLTLEYSAPVINKDVTALTRVGGITGNSTGNTSILNCIVRGVNPSNTLSVDAKSGNSQEIHIGGIAGNFEGSGFIQNCRAALSISYLSSGHSGEVYIGGIAGRTGQGSTNNKLRINNGYSNDSKDFDINRLLINGVTISVNLNANKQNSRGVIGIGGAVGISNNNTINDVEFLDGTILFNKSSTGSDSLFDRYGGLIGNSNNTNIINCFFSGNIGSVSNQTGYLARIGGLVGDNTTTTVGEFYINNCTVRGNIELNNIRTIYVGGVIGRSSKNDNTSISKIITNTFFEGNITVRGSAAIYAGGFCGLFEHLGQHTKYNCGVLEGTIDVNTDGAAIVGGFTSQFTGNISNCFSKIDIIANLFGLSNIGGFIGNLITGSVISSCYATGNILVIRDDSTTGQVNSIGGLVGTSGGNTTVSDSYALGNVFVNEQNGNTSIHVGGLVGSLGNNGSGDIINCFAAGQVIAQSRSGEVHAGGLVGQMFVTGGSIRNSSALGVSVTAKTPHNSRNAGRIYGTPTSGMSNNNYARDDMRLEVSNDYNTVSFPFWDGVVPVLPDLPPTTYYRYPSLDTVGFATMHGENASLSAFRNPLFWEKGGFDNLSGDITFHNALGERITSAAIGTPVTVRYSGEENITRRWFRNGAFITNTTGVSTYTPPVPTQWNPVIGSYTVIVYNDNYNSLTSASITVVAASGDPYLTGYLTISPKTDAIGSVLTAAYSGTETVTYQWLRNGLEIAGATTASYTADSLGRYTVRASSPGFPAITSQSITITGNSSDRWNYNNVVRDGHPRLKWE